MSQVLTATILPATVNHTIYRGDSFILTRRIKIDGSVVDISADTIKCRIVDNRGTVLHNLTIGAGITLGTTGVFQVALTPTQTAALPINCELRFDIEWTRSSGFKKTLEAGIITVVADVTP